MTHRDVLPYLRQSLEPGAKLVADTRLIAKGDVFLAYSVGHGKAQRDGRIYITQALTQGAAYTTRGQCDHVGGVHRHQAVDQGKRIGAE